MKITRTIFVVFSAAALGVSASGSASADENCPQPGEPNCGAANGAGGWEPDPPFFDSTFTPSNPEHETPWTDGAEGIPESYTPVAPVVVQDVAPVAAPEVAAAPLPASDPAPVVRHAPVAPKPTQVILVPRGAVSAGDGSAAATASPTRVPAPLLTVFYPGFWRIPMVAQH